MCKPGNQTIFKECRDIILQKRAKTGLSIRELRLLIKRNGGCVAYSALDKADKHF